MSARPRILPERYRDPRLVARGGMGEVYCATDVTLNRTVAIKLLDERYGADEMVRKRFRREALAAARLSSDPNIVTIFDVGEWGWRPYIVMEYLPGGSLHDVLSRDGPRPAADVLGWLDQAARALDHAHDDGVIHRDIKPANLLVGADGRVHVADFGVASAAGLDALTQTGTVVGTAGYLSPEQAEGRVVTSASDRYALAIVAFELLTGSRPFEQESATAEAIAHVREPVPPISVRRRGIPTAADAVFTRALAKDPAQRFTTCAEFVAALRSAFTAGEEPTRILPIPPHRHPRRLLPFALGAALLLAAGAVAAVALTRGGGAPSARTVVVTETKRGAPVKHTATANAALPPPPAGATASATTPASAAAEAAQGFAAMEAGDYARAVALLGQAARAFQGSGSLAEAYNDYNLAFSLAKTQGCSPQVVELLDQSQTIQGARTPITALRSACATAAAAAAAPGDAGPAPPGPPGHAPGGPGKGHGHGHG